MAKAELFENKLIGGFLKSLGAFPISRGTGGAQGIQTAIDLLEEEKVVCMFPEGTRSKPASFLNPKMGYGNAGVQDALYDFACGDRGRGGKPPKVFKKMVINIGKPIRFEDMGLTEDSGMIYRRVSRNIFCRGAEAARGRSRYYGEQVEGSMIRVAKQRDSALV